MRGILDVQFSVNLSDGEIVVTDKVRDIFAMINLPVMQTTHNVDCNFFIDLFANDSPNYLNKNIFKYKYIMKILLYILRLNEIYFKYV